MTQVNTERGGETWIPTSLVEPVFIKVFFGSKNCETELGCDALEA